MATRYVWGKYNINTARTMTYLTEPITYEYDEGGTASYDWPYDSADADYIWMMHPDYYNFGTAKTLGTANGVNDIYYSTSVTFTGNTKTYNGVTCAYEVKLNNPTSTHVGYATNGSTISFTIPAGNYFCLGSDTFWVITRSYGEMYVEYANDDYEDDPEFTDVILDTYIDPEYEEDRWKPGLIMGAYAYNQFKWSYKGGSYGGGAGGTVTYNDSYLRCPIVEDGQSKGSFISYATSSLSYAHTNNGVEASGTSYYWYEYLGSDNIDPTGITVTSTIVAGSWVPVSFSITAPTPKYGTVTYIIKYIGNSTLFGSNGRLTSKTGTISGYVPADWTTINFYVTATDDVGYTSANSVKSADYPISQYTNYAGVSGVVKGVSPKVCVGGQIKTNVTVKKGVNGTVY